MLHKWLLLYRTDTFTTIHPVNQDSRLHHEHKKLLKPKKKVRYCSAGCQVIINLSIVYQHRVVEFLRQDDIISIIAGRYDGPINDELRYCTVCSCSTILRSNDHIRESYS